MLQHPGNDVGSEESGGGPPLRYAKLGKDPTVRTDFLPDKDRERQEEELREKLKVGMGHLLTTPTAVVVWSY
jgi:hypothetical protein